MSGRSDDETDRDGAGPGGEAAYRLVDEALREDPGFALPADFAERVAARVRGGEERLGWFERVVLPLLVLPMAGVALRAGREPLLLGLGAAREAAGEVAALAPRLPAGPAAAVAAALLAVAVADRLLGARG